MKNDWIQTETVDGTKCTKAEREKILKSRNDYLKAELKARNFKDYLETKRINKVSCEYDVGLPYRVVLEDYAEIFGGTVRKCPLKNEYIVTFKDKENTVKVRC